MFYIYTILNTQNYKVYVGQTKNVSNRWSAHKSEAKGDKLHYPLYKALRKYGIENFQITIIETLETAEEADLAEQKWITKLESRNQNKGYNLAPGGSVPRGWHHSEESKKKISEGNLGKVMSEESRQKMSVAKSGENHPNYGNHLSEEVIQKISQAHQGKPLSEEHIQKLSESHMEHIHPQEVREKMSASHKGKKKSEEHRANISKSKTGKNNPMFGKKQSRETINKKIESRKRNLIDNQK